MPKPSWTVRRRIVVLTLLWCVGMVTYLGIWGRPVSLSETIATGCLLLMASVIGTYVFGAAWDDKNVMQIAKRRAVAEDDYSGPAMPPPQEGN